MSITREELIKKVRRIEITTRKVVDDVMSGNYRSHFKGQGLTFSEHRVYNPGDDIRHIDWKVSARTRDPMIKKFEEERELSVLLISDLSSSQLFSTAKKTKSEITAELGSIIAYAAIHTGDKVGALFFTDKVEKMIPPRKGKSHVLRIVRDFLDFKPVGTKTKIASSLEAAKHVMKHSGVVFILSDFRDSGYERELKKLSKKHDVVALWIQDEREVNIPDLGLVRMLNPETGEESFVDTSSYLFKNWFSKTQKDHQEKTDAALKSAGVEMIKIHTREDYVETLVRFFRARARRR